MHGVFPDEKKIACKDCKFRDKTIVTVGSVTKAVGVTRATCEVYDAKPTKILFRNAPCEYYQKDS